jgi:hypothetical protein
MRKVKSPDRADRVLIFRMWFRHWKTGKIICTGRPIPMRIKA